MKVAVYSSKAYDRQFLEAANACSGSKHDLHFFEARLDIHTAKLSAGSEVICVFVNDCLDAEILAILARQDVRFAALRCAGYNNVDLAAADRLGVSLARVPAYSPASVAEHTLALILTLNRKTHRSYSRVREGNFSLDGLLGFDLKGRKIGIVGTGKIGMATARILNGFGCDLLASDPEPNSAFEALGGRYVDIQALYTLSDIVTLHCPLTPQTHHMIDHAAIAAMKRGVMLINTSRGGVIDTRAAIAGLKAGKIGYLGLDVYEEEAELFFEDLSDIPIQDEIFTRLLTFPNVLITGHQGFFTEDAMTAIGQTTIANITEFERTGKGLHELNAAL